MNIILHAGTHKNTGSRPYMYETSSEYVRGLISLIYSIEKLSNTYLIIRFRESLECTLDDLKNLLPKSKNYEIKTKGSFIDDLSLCDLLISYSSTTLEEALNNFLPVALYGGENKFRYLKGSSEFPEKNKRNAVYYLNNDNIVDMIKLILKFHKNKPLTSKELKNYIWKNNKENFIDIFND